MLDITLPLFTTSELCRAAGLAPHLAKVWLQRGLIEPGRTDQLAVRKRPLFSVAGIFRAALARQLGEQIEIGPFEAGAAGGAPKTSSSAAIKQIAASTRDDAETLVDERKPERPGINQLARVITDEGWMWAVARSVERGKPLPLFGGVSKDGGCWSFYVELDAQKLHSHFAPDAVYAVVPIGAIFARVYTQCKSIYTATTAENPRKKGRA